MDFKILFIFCLALLFKFQQLNACNRNTNDNEPNYGTCGQKTSKSLDSNQSEKIINGGTATPNSWPWIVSLRVNGKHICGGTLIHQQYVLTAAHCIEDFSILTKQLLTVIVGLHNVDSYSASQVYQVDKLIQHEFYISTSVEKGYDIALIKLRSSVQLSSAVSLLCLPSKNSASLVLGQFVTTAGWGRIDSTFDPIMAAQLQELKLKVANNDPVCPETRYDSKLLYCLYDTNGSGQSQVCQGDSGSPFFYTKDNKWYIFGLVSYSNAEESGDNIKCLTKNPAYFTNVPYYIDWIVSKIDNN